MRKQVKININQKYGRLIPITQIKKKGRLYWVCKCECGSRVEVIGFGLANGSTQSCGCLRSEAARINVEINRPKATHNMTNTSEYKAWQQMKQRCYNPKMQNYIYYGARGILVCESWLISFENFYADTGEKPRPKFLYSIDRINNNGNYEPSNCRWTTAKIQMNNRRQ